MWQSVVRWRRLRHSRSRRDGRSCLTGLCKSTFVVNQQKRELYWIYWCRRIGVYWNRWEVSVNRGVILFDYHLVVVGGYNWTEVIPRETTAERIEKFKQKTRRKTNFRIQENQDSSLRFLRLSILKLLHFRDSSCFLWQFFKLDFPFPFKIEKFSKSDGNWFRDACQVFLRHRMDDVFAKYL